MDQRRKEALSRVDRRAARHPHGHRGDARTRARRRPRMVEAARARRRRSWPRPRTPSAAARATAARGPAAAASRADLDALVATLGPLPTSGPLPRRRPRKPRAPPPLPPLPRPPGHPGGHPGRPGGRPRPPRAPRPLRRPPPRLPRTRATPPPAHGAERRPDGWRTRQQACRPADLGWRAVPGPATPPAVPWPSLPPQRAPLHPGAPRRAAPQPGHSGAVGERRGKPATRPTGPGCRRRDLRLSPSARPPARPRRPARCVPVPPLLDGAVVRGGPGHHVRRTGRDDLVTPRAAVVAGRRGAADLPHLPFPVRPDLDACGGGGRTRRHVVIAPPVDPGHGTQPL